KMQVRTADGRGRHFHDSILGVLDTGLGLLPHLDPVRSVVGQRSHGRTLSTRFRSGHWQTPPNKRAGRSLSQLRAAKPQPPAKAAWTTASTRYTGLIRLFAT